MGKIARNRNHDVPIGFWEKFRLSRMKTWVFINFYEEVNLLFFYL